MARNTENVTITFEKDMLVWVDNNRGRLHRSVYVRDIIREKMQETA